MERCIDFLVLWPFLGAIVTWILGRNSDKRRNIAAAVTVTVELLAAAVLYLYQPVTTYISTRDWLRIELFGGADGFMMQTNWPGFCGMGLAFVAEGFRKMYVLIAAFMWFVSTLFSFEYMKHYENKNRYYFFLLLTLSATVGIFLSADFFTMFVFFEIMSFASYVWVAQDERKESLRAAETYLAIAVIGGLCILMGMFLLYGETGTLSTIGGLLGYSASKKTVAAGLLMLLGFGAKAGAVPLHIWLPKAHPVAPAPASALLSGILTKTGVFGTMLLTLQLFCDRATFGWLIFVIGILTMVTGAVLALFSVDLKRTLACSSVSQIGFIFTGLGMAGVFSAKLWTYGGNLWTNVNTQDTGIMELLSEGLGVSLDGTVLHMVNHSLIKLALFSAAGVVFMNLHKLNLNDIRGFGRKKPLLHVIFLAGALGIAGVPLFNGYVSKSLIHDGLVLWQEEFPAAAVKVSEWLFIISGGLTAAYMTKLYVALFWEKNQEEARQEEFDGKKNYMSRLTAILLTAVALLFPVIGIVGGSWSGVFNWESLSGALLSLLIGAGVYLLVVRRWLMKDGAYVDRWKPEWDLEERVYRPLLKVLDIVVSVVCRLLDRLPDYLIVGLRKTAYKDAALPHELEEGDALTHAVGTLMDDGKEALNHTIYKKHPIKISFEHRLAMWREELQENNTMIARSLSFGLLLFCVGLLMTLLYMLLV
ncbi:MAG: complex I subunit 5 family protein [Lachnospiraceae bacterium]